jgi:hypothetical protein
MCRVVNKYKEEYDVYIGRGSKWGNPFAIGKDGTREEVVEKYRDYLWKKIVSREILIGEILELDGNRLGCYCSPKLCHGNVLVDAVQWAKTKGYPSHLIQKSKFLQGVRESL